MLNWQYMVKSHSSTVKNHLDDLATDRTNWLVYGCKESGASKPSSDRKLFNPSLAVNDRHFGAFKSRDSLKSSALGLKPWEQVIQHALLSIFKIS